MQKFYKNYIALDLEMNQPSGKIIQIGAVVGDIETGETEEFCIFVNPEETLSSEIVSLTGIQDFELIGEPTIRQAGEILVNWMKERKKNITMNPLTWGGGDHSALVQQSWISPHVFGRRWIDVKTIYAAYALANGFQPVGGLSTSLRKAGLRFRGTPHNALDDAKNTFTMFRFLLSQFKESIYS